MTALRSLGSLLALPALLLAGCSSADPLPRLPPTDSAQGMNARASSAVTTAQAVAAFRQVGEREHADGYRLGAGDRISVEVWNRPDLSGTQAIGPDGTITLPVVGDLMIGQLSRAAALEAVRASFASAYADLVITLRVDSYESLRVVVLGQVASPGEHRFNAPPDLLRAIGAAGGVRDAEAVAATAQPHLAAANATRRWKAAIVRGSDAVLWVDLNALLREGDMSLNVPLITGDVVHVSSEALRMIYVLGEVAQPGIYPLRDGATVMDALAMAGGTTPDANDDEVRLLRPAQNQRADFDYDSYALGSFDRDLALAAGDVVYVPASWAGEIGYFLRQFSPLAQMLLFAEAVQD